jgi:hypothetical protein
MYAHKHGLIGKFFTELIFGAKKIIRDVASGCCHQRSRVGENFVQSLHAGAGTEPGIIYKGGQQSIFYIEGAI